MFSRPCKGLLKASEVAKRSLVILKVCQKCFLNQATNRHGELKGFLRPPMIAKAPKKVLKVALRAVRVFRGASGRSKERSKAYDGF